MAVSTHTVSFAAPCGSQKSIPDAVLHTAPQFSNQAIKVGL